MTDEQQRGKGRGAGGEWGGEGRAGQGHQEDKRNEGEAAGAGPPRGQRPTNPHVPHSGYAGGGGARRRPGGPQGLGLKGHSARNRWRDALQGG